MKISKDDFKSAAYEILLNEEQAEAIWRAMEKRAASAPQFSLAHVAYYFGAMIVISAMGWFMTLGWESFGGSGIAAISFAYAIGFFFAGRALWNRRQGAVPGGLLLTLAVWMTPLIVYGIERATGVWPQGDPGAYRNYHIWVKGSWFAMEVATIMVSAVLLKFYRFPFLTFPAAFSLWYMSMDLTPTLFGKTDFTWNQRLWVSLAFGLAMLLASFAIDRRTKGDFAFWGYLFGTLAFWSGLSLMDSGSELGKFLYCLINAGMIFLSVLLKRRVFIVFGALGVFGYLAHLSDVLFKDSWLFPFALSAIGLLIIYLGVQFQRRQAAIERAVMRLIPESVRSLLPQNRH